ncbi:MAG: hypothetical protein ACLP4V_09940, partial [Methylocella sp.]
MSADAVAILDAPLRLSPSARIQDGPVLDGVLVRRQRVLVDPGLDEALAYRGGVKVAPLLETTRLPIVR